MAKLALFALTFTAIVAFSTMVSAYKTTIITTTTDDNVDIPMFDSSDNGVLYFDSLDDNRRGSEGQCARQISPQQLNHCQMHLAQGVSSRRPFQQEQQHLQQCCDQLRSVSEECQCEAIQLVFDQARRQAGAGESRQMLSKAQRLPTECRLEVQSCPLRSPRLD